ncbi:hypothetical protein [Mesorhizobium sp. 43Arga]
MSKSISGVIVLLTILFALSQSSWSVAESSASAQPFLIRVALLKKVSFAAGNGHGRRYPRICG